jgi:hypothetical protein
MASRVVPQAAGSASNLIGAIRQGHFVIPAAGHRRITRGGKAYGDVRAPTASKTVNLPRLMSACP